MLDAQGLADRIREGDHELLLASSARPRKRCSLKAQVLIQRPNVLSGEARSSIVFTVEVWADGELTEAYKGDELYAACLEYIEQSERNKMLPLT